MKTWIRRGLLAVIVLLAALATLVFAGLQPARSFRMCSRSQPPPAPARC
jgi:hypothetical protein